MERVGEVAYRLELPPTSLLHPVFHVSLLKKSVGDHIVPSKKLPTIDEEGHIVLRLEAALNYRTIKKGRRKAKTWQVLIQWQGYPKEEVTWEDYEEMKQQFPGLTLEDKGVLEGGEIDKDPPPRRSQRIAKAQELESEAHRLACDMEQEVP